MSFHVQVWTALLESSGVYFNFEDYIFRIPKPSSGLSRKTKDEINPINKTSVLGIAASSESSGYLWSNCYTESDTWLAPSFNEDFTQTQGFSLWEIVFFYKFYVFPLFNTIFKNQNYFLHKASRSMYLPWLKPWVRKKHPYLQQRRKEETSVKTVILVKLAQEIYPWTNFEPCVFSTKLNRHI